MLSLSQPKIFIWCFNNNYGNCDQNNILYTKNAGCSTESVSLVWYQRRFTQDPFAMGNFGKIRAGNSVVNKTGPLASQSAAK